MVGAEHDLFAALRDHARHSHHHLRASGTASCGYRARCPLRRGRRPPAVTPRRGKPACRRASVVQAPPFPRNVPTGCGRGGPSCWARQARIARSRGNRRTRCGRSARPGRSRRDSSPPYRRASERRRDPARACSARPRSQPRRRRPRSRSTGTSRDASPSALVRPARCDAAPEPLRLRMARYSLTTGRAGRWPGSLQEASLETHDRHQDFQHVASSDSFARPSSPLPCRGPGARPMRCLRAPSPAKGFGILSASPALRSMVESRAGHATAFPDLDGAGKGTHQSARPCLPSRAG